MAPATPRESGPASLNDLTSQALHLLTTFSTALSPMSTTTSSASLPADPPNPLHVLRDSAKLLKAQTTKLSLLILNKPFTPSAIEKVLREVTGMCIPAMMSAVEITEMQAERWGRVMVGEVRARVRCVVTEIRVMVEEVGTVARADAQNKRAKVDGDVNVNGKKGSGTGASRDSLASIGVVWQTCDALIELEALGIAGVVVQKAEQYRETLRDAIEELKEWAEEGEGESEDEFAESDEGSADGNGVEEFFDTAKKLPKDRKDLRMLLDKALDKLKKISVLYQALIKRRLKTFAAGGESVMDTRNLDDLMDILKALPEIVDELANAFYELDEPDARDLLSKCCKSSKQAAELVRLSWDEREDEFTPWSKRFQPYRHNADESSSLKKSIADETDSRHQDGARYNAITAITTIAANPMLSSFSTPPLDAVAVRVAMLDALLAPLLVVVAVIDAFAALDAVVA
ncbi:hypothetical protein LTR50_000645 [Elasticomyces elasticus]|nr:hypothetical protein LTR50_000645 [Elasticomyces elasticus]